MELTIDNLITWPLNPRRIRDRDIIEEMKASLLSLGQFQPLLVARVPHQNSLWHVIEGETRRIAFVELIQQGKLPVDHPIRVWQIPDDQEEMLLSIAIAGNSIRRDLDPIDQAEAFATLRKCGMSEQQIADNFGISRLVVQQRIALSSLIDEAKELIRNKTRPLAWGQAMTLAPEKLQERICVEIRNNPSCFQTAGEVRSEINRRGIPARHAIFNIDRLGSGVHRDLFGTDDVILDVAGFWTLQEEAVKDLAKELKQRHAEVHVFFRQPFDSTGWVTGGDSETSHAIIVVSAEGEVTVLENMIPPEALDSVTSPVSGLLDAIDITDFMADEKDNAIDGESSTNDGQNIAQAPNDTEPNKDSPGTPAVAAFDAGYSTVGNKLVEAFLSQIATADLRIKVLDSDRLAKTIVCLASLACIHGLGRVHTNPFLVSSNSPQCTDWKRADIQISEEMERLGITTTAKPADIVAAFVNMDNSTLDRLFRYFVARLVSIRLHSREAISGFESLKLLGADPLNNWRISEEYLETMNNGMLRSLAVDFGIYKPEADASKRKTLIRLILKQVDMAEAGLLEEELVQRIRNHRPIIR